MLNVLVTYLASFALLAQAVFGCCWHHVHEVQGESGDTVRVAHFHSGLEPFHHHEEEHDDAGTGGEEHNEAACAESNGVVIGPRVDCPDLELNAVAAVALPPSAGAGVDLSAAPELGLSPLAESGPRAHLLHSILLL